MTSVALLLGTRRLRHVAQCGMIEQSGVASSCRVLALPPALLPLAQPSSSTATAKRAGGGMTSASAGAGAAGWAAAGAGCETNGEL